MSYRTKNGWPSWNCRRTHAVALAVFDLIRMRPQFTAWTPDNLWSRLSMSEEGAKFVGGLTRSVKSNAIERSSLTANRLQSVTNQLSVIQSSSLLSGETFAVSVQVT